MSKTMHVRVWYEDDPHGAFDVEFSMPNELADDPREVQRFAMSAVLDECRIAFDDPVDGPVPDEEDED